MKANNIEISDNEHGFELYVYTDEGCEVINIQNIDLDAFYDQVKARIGPYLQERDEARRTAPVAAYDASEAYELTDPKHPEFHSVHADLWDARAGK